ncbi:hypothetical protein J1N35_010821 [Gossypium stocksii]|uniref:Uncharacterized protein n=1 Tax=Gossypium stocksii TaxID=47602 RepID=A0A9D4ACP8_9ROSI|nr:hypothetical protein J1N35_010821 [Gossypium stocksii]
MAGELIRLGHKLISVEQKKMAKGAIGPETHQHVHREMETRDAHIPSLMRRVYHYFGGRTVTIGIASEWVCTHRIRSMC